MTFFVAYDPDCDWPSPFKVFVSEANWRSRQRRGGWKGSRLFEMRLTDEGLDMVREVSP